MKTILDRVKSLKIYCNLYLTDYSYQNVISKKVLMYGLIKTQDYM